MHSRHIKPFRFDPEKNRRLKQERNISFEEIILLILNDRILDIISHVNRAKYPGQKIFIVEYQGAAYAVPYVEEIEYIFLKTIYPSRKLTKLYLKKGDEHEH
jgi:uncharacterized DUF497 family protein